MAIYKKKKNYYRRQFSSFSHYIPLNHDNKHKLSFSSSDLFSTSNSHDLKSSKSHHHHLYKLFSFASSACPYQRCHFHHHCPFDKKKKKKNKSTELEIDTKCSHNNTIKQKHDKFDSDENEFTYLEHCTEEIEVSEFLTCLEVVEYLKNRLNNDNLFIYTKNEPNGFYYPADANKRLYEFKTQLYVQRYFKIYI